MNIINDGAPEVSAALAAQEEHIKRSRSCMGQVGRPHSFREFGSPKTGAQFRACVACGVTATPDDYERSGRGPQ